MTSTAHKPTHRPTVTSASSQRDLVALSLLLCR
jgi:hypothetical protein